MSGPVLAAALAIEAWALRRGAPDATVVRVGMGPKRATRALAKLLERAPTAIGVGGVCGAIDPSLVPGDIVVAEALLGPGGERIELDPAPLLAALSKHGIEARAGAIVGSPKLFGGPGRAAHAARGACAVDMESFWLAPARERCAFAVLRVVSDGPGHELTSPTILRDGARAIRNLRRAAPALAAWAREAAR